MTSGDVLGHEPMSVAEEVGSAVQQPEDRSCLPG